MSNDLHDDDDGFDAFVKDALPELAPRAGFVDDVLARQPARRRWWAVAAPFVGGAVAASLAFAVIDGPSSSSTQQHGSVVADSARVVAIDGATISLQPGAAIDWDGPRLRLRHGEAFFRVDHRANDAAPFIVTTPGGDVVVTGTCFTVSVGDPMSTAKSALTFVAGGLVGAVIASVAVHEGEVQLKNDHGSVAVAAGERGTLDANNAPTKGGDVARAERRLAAVLATIAATESAAAGDTKELVAENTRLRALVKKQDEELGLLDVERVDRDGEPVPFPKDLPPRLTEKALLTAFTTALKDAGIDGDVSAIDCAEFPCIVWGEMKGDTAKLSNALKTSKAFEPYKDDGKHVRGWGAGEGNTELFAMTVTPEDPAMTEEQKEALDRRIRYRANSGYEANKPASWADADKK